MTDFENKNNTTGWFRKTGPEFDVVISTRVRLARNLSGYLFPGVIEKDDEDKVQDVVKKAFSAINSSDDFTVLKLKELTPTERKMLLERNIISQDYSLQTERFLIIGKEKNIFTTINEIDHLRISSITGGLDLQKAYETVNSLDNLLEQHLDYAVSLDLGYLNTEITNIGTGMRSSVMLHLPALVKTQLIDKAFKAVMQIGLRVKGFFGDDEHSLGNMYQISNQISLGISEKEINEKLENITLQIVNYERKARKELLEKGKVDLEDEVFRAYGVLKHCKSLSSKEAIEFLSALRMGIAMGLIELPIEEINAAIFLTQKAHMQQLINSQEIGADIKLIDYTRSNFVKKCLEESSKV